MKPEKYSQIMSENGRKGGIAKGQAYHKKINQIIAYFINTNFSQQVIAQKLNVSQAMVSKYTNNDLLKIERLKNNVTSETEIKLNKLLLEIELDKKNNQEITLKERIKKLKI